MWLLSGRYAMESKFKSVVERGGLEKDVRDLVFLITTFPDEAAVVTQTMGAEYVRPFWNHQVVQDLDNDDKATLARLLGLSQNK